MHNAELGCARLTQLGRAARGTYLSNNYKQLIFLH